MPHQVIIRTADMRAYSTLDLLTSDNLYKLIVFTGEVKDAVQRERLEKLGEVISQWPNGISSRFQLYTVM